jgi:hypothetical protein
MSFRRLKLSIYEVVTLEEEEEEDEGEGEEEKVVVVVVVMETREGGRKEYWASILTLTFGITRTVELSAVGMDRNLPPRKLLGTHFC